MLSSTGEIVWAAQYSAWGGIDRLLVKAIAQQGMKLRRALVEFVDKRLNTGVEPHIVFISIAGPLRKKLSLTAENIIDVRLEDLELFLSNITYNQVVRIIRG